MNGTRTRRIAAVERYVHDLAIALAGIPVDEREDVIAGVREHIEDSLAGVDDPAPEDVERVLTSLGDPAEIAADARGRSSAPHNTADPNAAATGPVVPPAGVAPQGAAKPRSRSLLTREWIPVGVMGLFGLAAFTTWLFGPGSTALGVLFWLGGLVALVASPLWSVAEKVVGTLWFGGLPIVTGLAAVVLGWIYMPVPRFGVDRFGPPVGTLRDAMSFNEWGWLAAAGFGLVGLIGTVVIMAWLVTVGSRRAGQVAAG